MNRNNIFYFLKFIIGTALGVGLVLIPFNFNGTVDTVLFYYLKLFIKSYHPILFTLVTFIVIASAILAFYDNVCKPNWIRNNALLNMLFSTTPFYVANRFCGAIIAFLCYFQVGPSFIISADTGGNMVSLATQLSVLVPAMLLVQTCILEFGAMEFIGRLIGFIFKPIFKVSELCAVSIISAWVGPGNAAILGTKELFDNGYFTTKEAAIIGSQFSTSSVGWIVLVCSIFDLMDHFGTIFLIITLIGIVVAFIGVRIPPISRYPNTYVNDKGQCPVVEEKIQSRGRLKAAVCDAIARSKLVSAKNFIAKKNNMSFYVVWLQPIIIFWGTLALVISVYTPILRWISYPVKWFLLITDIDDAAQTASAIMSGFADNYLPVILGQNISSSTSRCIIAIMSILQVIFMSEIATLLKSTDIIKRFSDILIIFILRTVISLPIVILFVKLFNI